MENNQLSPTPFEAPVLMTFPQAMEEIIKGERVTRLDWNNTDYGLLKDGWLSIHRNGEDFVWKVSGGDLLAVDWIVTRRNN